MELSIVIVNFNTLQYTVDCIQSIVQHTSGLEYEIILVDNAPKQNYEPTFSALPVKLTYLRSEENLGFGRANNLGIDHAKGQYLLLLNSDTLVTDNSLKKCVDYLNLPEASSIGLLGCKLLNEDLTYQASFYPFIRHNLFSYFISNNPVLYKIFKVGQRYQAPAEITKVGDVSGAFMLLRNEVIEKVKAFDPDFFLYCEETEWCRNRIAKAYDIVYYPHASIIHLGGKSAPKDLMYVQSQISLGLYWYKTGWLNYIAHLIFSLLNGIYYILTYPITGAEGKSLIRRYLKCYFSIPVYLFIKIPKYGRAWGRRKEPLIYEKARNIFFGETK